MEKLTLSPEEVGPEDIRPLRAAGLNDRAIEEVLYVCFLYNMIDRMADAFDFYVPTPEEFERHAAYNWLTLMEAFPVKARSCPFRERHRARCGQFFRALIESHHRLRQQLAPAHSFILDLMKRGVFQIDHEQIGKIPV